MTGRAVLLALLVLSGCKGVTVGRHITAANYTRSPQRIFVIDRLDRSFDAAMPRLFADAMVRILGSCHVAAVVFESSGMVLDAEARLARAMGEFKADAVLNMQFVRRVTMDGEPRAGTYRLTLTDLVEKRQVWRVVIGMGASTRLLASRSDLGGDFADRIVRTMAGDGVLKSCPAFPPLVDE